MKSRISVLLVAFAMLFAAAIPETATGKSPKVRNGMIEFPEPARAKGQTDVLQLRCDPIPVVRVAFIGLGMRGSMAVERYTHLDGVRIVALCDVRPELVENAQGTLKNAGLPAAAGYTGAEDWKKVCEREDVELIYNCTPWLLHTPIAVYAMRHGKHVALEVPAAMSIDECWQLVNTAEQTRRHCMMLENCCYDFFEMATLNMAQQGLFGEVMHVEGAYIHDLRSLNLDDKTGYYDMWRLKYNTDHTGNPYPTHGLGPVCQILNIHRGDKMDYLVSVSTDQKGLSLAAAGKFGKDSEYAETDYKLGDMNTTLIRTAKGKTILIQHDQLMAEYEHPISTEIGEKARQVGGHGGMDFIMDYRLIYCLHNGLPLDQDVYDAAEWSSLVELTETSVKHRGMPVKVPDFTRGAWNRINGFSHAVK